MNGAVMGAAMRVGNSTAAVGGGRGPTTTTTGATVVVKLVSATSAPNIRDKAPRNKV